MAKMTLRAYPAKPGSYGGFSIVFDLTGKPDPFPPRDIEVRTTAEALTWLDAYAAEAKEIGTPMAVALRVADGSRAPNGFKAATEKLPRYVRVNV